MTTLVTFVDRVLSPRASCLNCRYSRSWCYPASYHEPGDYGWECSRNLDRDIELPEKLLDYDELGEYYAGECLHYQRMEDPVDFHYPDEL